MFLLPCPRSALCCPWSRPCALLITGQGTWGQQTFGGLWPLIGRSIKGIEIILDRENAGRDANLFQLWVYLTSLKIWDTESSRKTPVQATSFLKYWATSARFESVTMPSILSQIVPLSGLILGNISRTYRKLYMFGKPSHKYCNRLNFLLQGKQA